MTSSRSVLTTQDHSRDSAGLTYVYPVVSRRAGGLSIGINLNPNNACNWRCIYCQVPELKRGSAPPIDLQLLEKELRTFVNDVVNGSFLDLHVPVEARRLNDIALSGNGEPTSAREFAEVVRLIGSVIRDFSLLNKIKLVLITNGSFMHRDNVRDALREIASLNGEVWFKIDRATPEAIREINGTRISVKRILENLAVSAQTCPTWVQTCMFALDGEPPADTECEAYLNLLQACLERNINIQGVLLYGLARPSMQAEASRLTPLPESWLEAFGMRIQALGVKLKLNP